MTSWLVRRVADTIASAAIACALLVALVHLMPGDPVAASLADRPVDAATLAAVREAWGMDRPLHVALAAFARDALHGDLGVSIAYQRPVTQLLAERIGPTALLGILTLLINFTVGLGLGLWSALRDNTVRGRAIGAIAVVGYALPGFAIGSVLVWLFAVQLGWLPVAGMTDPLLPETATTAERARDVAHHLLLPLVAMVLATIAVPIRLQRAAARGTIGQAWVRAAEARGVSPAAVAWRHCWRPALTPVVTLLGLWLPLLVSGAVLVESLFAWPGIGSLIAEATATRDIPVVVGAGLLLVVAVQVGSLVADILYRVVDPRQQAA